MTRNVDGNSPSARVATNHKRHMNGIFQDKSSGLASGTSTQAAASLTVFYDGACPLCRREIAFYQGLDRGQRLQWRDVSQTAECPDGYCQTDLLARFHVMTDAGRMLSGAQAFAAVWRALPAPWPLLGRVAQWPVIDWLLEGAYRLFLRLRPWWRGRI
jgi:predicted DCC family thiol-disulfide oxidoreductase YuxK